ncbi:hypothetical protein [Sorangium sp. So ce388]|uniref:hypothetical protein n=1 Tax=Sorangium sp. So ce388 TaxID=3133309 RepID=UPI003F5BF583
MTTEASRCKFAASLHRGIGSLLRGQRGSRLRFKDIDGDRLADHVLKQNGDTAAGVQRRRCQYGLVGNVLGLDNEAPVEQVWLAVLGPRVRSASIISGHHRVLAAERAEVNIPETAIHRLNTVIPRPVYGWAGIVGH